MQTSYVSLLVCPVLLCSVVPSLFANDDSPIAERATKLLQEHCLRCHNDQDNAGELSLARDPVKLPNWDGKLLVEMVTPTNGSAEMPKESPSLSTEDVQVIAQWIEAGAKWPEGLELKPPRSLDPSWWSLQPLPSSDELNAKLHAAKQIAQASGMLQSENAIDAFVMAQLAEKKLVNSPPASRRVLIRRLYFDLIGLPPTPEEIAAFESDPNPQAYEKLVDTLLASPRYGERWARHWLDVAHYADTHGYDKDKLRPNAWPYRDYVIRSFNEDKPWSRFIHEQIAGDHFFPDTVDGIEALGFLAAGPWDFVGHAEVPESKIDGKIARHLDRDDMVRTVVQSFMSLTIGCAQCHDHKFDPIQQQEYYQLQAVFAAIDRADKNYFDDPKLTQEYAKLTAEKKTIDARIADFDASLTKMGGERWKSINERIKAGNIPGNLNDREEFGYHSNIEATADSRKWVQVTLPQAASLDRIVLRPAFDQFNNIGADFGLPVELTVELSADETADKFTELTKWSRMEQKNRSAGQVLSFQCDGRVARTIRVSAKQLTSRLPTDYSFALAELEAYDSSGENLARGAVVASLDSIEAPPRWRKSNLVDGIFPREGQSGLSLEQALAERTALTEELLGKESHLEFQALHASRKTIEARLQTFPKPKQVYAGTVHFGSGAFQGTGSLGGKAREIFVLHRGEVTSPRQPVQPGSLSLVPGMSSQLELPENHPEALRRAALAKWIASSENTFTWRSVVNRVWQYHFGSGLVDTPNDLGRMGGKPSHPELLDWLAVKFRDEGQSLKQLHRWIVTSQTYRQSSDGPLEAQQRELANSLDTENRFLWRSNRRKLDAEAVRDSILAISGKLDLKMGGPGFEEFVLEKPEHSPHYRYDLHDFEKAETHRRTIYRFTVRSQLQPFLNSLDCADPSIQVATRNQGQSPLQALAMLNNGMVIAHSKHFADKLRGWANAGDEATSKLDDGSTKQDGSMKRIVARGFEEATGRKATYRELEGLVQYAVEHGVENLCRLLFNLNEFAFVE